MTLDYVNSLHESLSTLLDDPDTTSEAVDAWEAAYKASPAFVKDSALDNRMRGAYRLASSAVRGQKGLFEARRGKALSLLIPVPSDYPPPEGKMVAVIRHEHGWHDGAVHGIYSKGVVTDADGYRYEIAHLRDIYEI